MNSIKVCEYSRSFHDDLILQDQASGERSQDQWSSGVEPPWVVAFIFCSQYLGHMTKMAATPIYGKNTSKIFYYRTGGPISTNLGM